MFDTIKNQLLAKKILLTFEEWYDANALAFEYVSNRNTPEELYAEYVKEIVADYAKINNIK